MNRRSSKNHKKKSVIANDINSFEAYEREERKKIMTMWVGVTIVMVIISGLWIYNTKKVFEQNKLKPSNSADFSFDKLSDSVKDISGKINELKQSLEVASTTLATTTNSGVTATSTATSTDLVVMASSASPIATTTGTVAGTSTVEIIKPEEVVKKLQEKLMASTTESGKVKGAFEERDIIGELKNKLENN